MSPIEDRRWEQLEQRIGYRFERRSLLEIALTHRSHSYEQATATGDYERLEFLGDAVLGFVVAEWLYLQDPVSPEGILSRRRQSVVSATVLKGVARELKLGDEMRLGVGEEQTGGRNKPALLADLYEAVLGAIYLDGGIGAARAFVERTLQEALQRVREISETIDDSKTRLQEQIQARLQRTPSYRIVSSSGPAHAPLFEVEVCLDDRVLGKGSGTSRKRAEQLAARDALQRMEPSE